LFGISKVKIGTSIYKCLTYFYIPILCRKMKSSPAGPIFEIYKVHIKPSFFFFLSLIFTLFLLPLLLLFFLFITFFILLSILPFLEVIEYSLDIAYVSELASDHEGCAAGGVELVGVAAVRKQEPDDVWVGVGRCVVDQVATVLVWEGEGRADLQEGL
jgi:hypothetical protein